MLSNRHNNICQRIARECKRAYRGAVSARTRRMDIGSIATGMLVSMILLIMPGHMTEASARQAMVFHTSDYPLANRLAIMNRGATEVKTSRRTVNIIVTSYNSVPEQTDDTPFITAFGTQVRDGIVAANFLPKGTQVRFPDLYGQKIFVVEDRMNIRYNNRVDIWSADQQFSRNFGVRFLRMEIL